MSLYVEALILQALRTYYGRSPRTNNKNIKKKEHVQKRKGSKKGVEPLENVILFSMKLLREEEKGIAPGYYRPLSDRLELVANIMYEQSVEFRAAIRELRERLSHPYELGNKRFFDRIDAQYSQKHMQHPEFIPNGIMDAQDYNFANSYEYEHQGRTHIEYLEEDYGGKIGFANQATYGKCRGCNDPLPVWRSCVLCANYFVAAFGEEIYTISRECPLQGHQRDLLTWEFCDFCLGYSLLDIQFYLHERTDFWLRS